MSNISNKFLGEVVETKEMLPSQPDIKPTEGYKYDIGVGDVFGRAMKNDSLAVIGVNKVMDMVDDNKYMIDDNFDAKKEIELYEDANIHPDLMDSLVSRAKNKEHLDSMMGYYKEQSAYQRELERYGFGSQFAMGAVAELTNAPIYLGAAALLPETALLMGSAAGLRFITAGGAGAAIEGLKDVLGEHDKKPLDYAAAILFDGTFGAAIGTRTKGNFNQLANNMVLKTHGMTKDVMDKVKNSKTIEEKKLIIQDAYKLHTGKQADNSLLDVLDENIAYANQNVVQKAWSSLRQDMAYVTGESSSETMRAFSKSMFPDGTLQNLDLNNPDMATARDLLEETMRAKRQTIFTPLTKEYIKLVHNSNGGFFGIRPTGMQEKEFGDMLGEVQMYRNIDGLSIEQAVRKVLNDKKVSENRAELEDILIRGGKGMEELALDYHKVLGENGHADFASGAIKEDGTYMPFIYNKESIATLLNKGVRKGDIAKFFKQAIKNNIPEIDDESLNAIAMAFYQAVSENTTRRMNTFDSILDEVLSSEQISDEAKAMISKIKKTKYEDGGDAKGNFSNQRTNIDYSHRQTFETTDGRTIELSFRDFLSKDYLNNMDTYVRKMSGTTVLRKFGWENKAELDFNINREDFKTDADYQKALNKMELEKTQAFNIARQELENTSEFLKLRKQIDEVQQGRMKDIESFRAVTQKILRDLEIDSKAYKQLEEAIIKEDFKKAGNIIFAEIQKLDNAIDGSDSAELFELIRKNITEPDARIKELEGRYKSELDAKANEVLEAKQKPTQTNLNTKDDYDELRNKVRNELNEAIERGEITVKEADKELVRLDTILKDMTGVATSKDPNGNLNRFYRIAHSYNVGRLLGQTFFTMPAEAMNVMWDMGLKSFIESSPAIKSLIKAYKSGNIDHAATREISESLGMYDEFLSSPRLYEFDHEFTAATSYPKAGKIVDKLEKFGENFAEFTLMTGGIKPLTAWFQTAHVMGVFKKMRAVAIDGKIPNSNYNKMIKELGLSKEMEQAVYQSIRDNYSDGLMNFNSWDTDIRNVFLQGVKRRTDTMVQMQRIGDKPAWVSEPDYMLKDTFTGKVVMELKQFVMTAYVKQLGRALNRKDQYMIGLIASQMAALTLSYITKQTLNYSGNEEKYKRAMKIENIIAGTMAQMPQGSVLPMVMNFGSNLMFGRDIIGSSRHNSQATDMISSLAIVDGISKVMEAFTIPSQIVTGEFDNKTLKPVAGLTGVSNHWLTKALWETTQNK